MHGSGSAGKPKAVLVGHLFTVAKLFSYQDAWQLLPHSKWLNKVAVGACVHSRTAMCDHCGTGVQTTYSFINWTDFEILFPLCFGSTVLTLPSGDEKNPELVNRAIIGGRVTHATFITSALMLSLQTRWHDAGTPVMGTTDAAQLCVAGAQA